MYTPNLVKSYSVGSVTMKHIFTQENLQATSNVFVPKAQGANMASPSC